MQNLIALSNDGTAAGPAILYSDRRLSADEVEMMRPGFRLIMPSAPEMGWIRLTQS